MASPSDPNTLPLRIGSIFIVAGASLAGCALAVAVEKHNKGDEDRDPQRLLRCLAAGVIVTVGFVHVLGDAAEQLQSVIEFPLAFVICTAGGLIVLILSQTFKYLLHHHPQRHGSHGAPPPPAHQRGGAAPPSNMVAAATPLQLGSQPDLSNLEDCQAVAAGMDHHDHHSDAANIVSSFNEKPLLLAYIMEVGIIFHSVIIGVGLGVITSSNRAVISLLIALCAHQFFEGAGLATAIAEARLPPLKTYSMIAVFSVTTSLGIAAGIGVAKSYDDESPTANWVQGVINSLAAGILIYVGWVEMAAEEFTKPEVASKYGLQAKMFAALLVGVTLMSVLAIWA